MVPWLVLCLTSPLELGRKYFCDNFLRKIPWLVLCLGGHQLGLNVGYAEAPGAVVSRVVASTPQGPGRVLKPQSTYFPRDETGLVCLPTQLERTLQLYW